MRRTTQKTRRAMPAINLLRDTGHGWHFTRTMRLTDYAGQQATQVGKPRRLREVSMNTPPGTR